MDDPNNRQDAGQPQTEDNKVSENRGNPPGYGNGEVTGAGVGTGGSRGRRIMMPTHRHMAHADMDIIERISRVLAGQYFSRNAAGAAGDDDASILVDQNWVDFQEDAVAVLKTLRQPPPALSNENDIALWGLVIQSALGQHAEH